MLKAYINYPNQRLTTHDGNCSSVQQQRKKAQRYVRINSGNLFSELKVFKDGGHQFSSNKGKNDMWLEVELNSKMLERLTVRHVRFLLGRKYRMPPIKKCEKCC